MTKIALFASSLTNALAGLALMATYLLAPAAGLPLIAFLTGLALCIQGTFTLAYMSPLVALWRAPATAALIAGEAASILAGGLAVANGVLYNLHPRNGDIELAPMSLGVLMLAQAALALLYASRRVD